jgi:RNA-binding protein
VWQTHAHAVKKPQFKQSEKDIMITPGMKRRIRHELSIEQPTVWVGKEGSTIEIMNEISRQLEQREMLKGKIQQTALKGTDAKQIATKIAQETGSVLIEVRGHTFMLYRKRRRKQAA